MKVVRVSNYDDEGPRGSQRVMAGPGLSAEDAETECRRLCDDPRRYDEDWYVVKEDDYVLYKFEP